MSTPRSVLNCLKHSWRIVVDGRCGLNLSGIELNPSGTVMVQNNKCSYIIFVLDDAAFVVYLCKIRHNKRKPVYAVFAFCE